MTNDPEKTIPLQVSKRIPELDGLRGVAISLVIIYHYFTVAVTAHRPHPLAYLQIATRLGWSGVDLFFVLSGFLIGGILLDARNSNNYFKVFYVRRACRILPVYFLFCGLIALWYFLANPSPHSSMDLLSGSMPWSSFLTFTQNLWMAHRNTLGPPLFAITWSLAVEEQFYLTLPAVVRFVRSSLLPWILVAGIVTAPLLRVSLLIWHPEAQAALYVLLPCRMDELLLGVFAAYLLRKPGVWALLVARRRSLWMALAVFAIGLGYLTTTSAYYSIPISTVGYDWLALFYLTAMILALVDSNSWLGRTMRWQWLRSLGAVAYGLYLIHVAVQLLCMFYLRGHGILLRNPADLGVTLLALGLTIALAQLSWRFFEKPIVRWGHKMEYEPRPISGTPSTPEQREAAS